MKKLAILLIAFAAFSCKPKKHEDPQPVSRYNNPAAAFELSGTGIGKSVIVKFILKDTLETQVIKEWSQTVTYTSDPAMVYLPLPGLPESGKYFQTSEVCYSSSCSTPPLADFTGEIYTFRRDGHDVVSDLGVNIN